MTRRITGTLKGGTGEALPALTIRLTATLNVPLSIPFGSRVEYTTDESGGYDLTLEDGQYQVVALYSGGPETVLGIINVTTGPDTDLITLLGAEGVSPSLAQQLLDQVADIDARLTAIETAGGANHTHSNLDVLALFSAPSGTLLWDGQPIEGGGGGGAAWHSGAGAPSSSLGEDGDHYLNTTNGDVYAKSGTWAVVANIMGPQGEPGPTGPAGPAGPQGPEGPQGPAGADGTSFSVDATGLLSERSIYDAQPEGFAFLATDTGDLYIREGVSGWSDAIPFRGPEGPQGATGPAGPQGEPGPAGADGAPGVDGATWYSGAGAPSGALGAEDDHYLNTTNGDVYRRDAGTWGIIANITGPQGIQGVEGETGPAGPGLPAGGTAGQMLYKSSATDYATEWGAPPSGSLPAGATQHDILVEGAAGPEWTDSIRPVSVQQPEHVIGNLGATPTIDPANGNRQRATINATATITLTAPAADTAHLLLHLTVDATGGYSITWTGASPIGGEAPELDMTANAENLVVLVYANGGWVIDGGSI